MLSLCLMELLTEFFHPVFAKTFQYARNEQDRCIYVRSKNSLDGPWTEWDHAKYFLRRTKLAKYGLSYKLHDN